MSICRILSTVLVGLLVAVVAGTVLIGAGLWLNLAAVAVIGWYQSAVVPVPLDLLSAPLWLAGVVVIFGLCAGRFSIERREVAA